jgi:hypothetical protein
MPDWGLSGSKEVVYRLQDMAELAVRLGSPVSYHRLGDVIVADSFEDGLAKCRADVAGTGGSISLSADTARSGGVSAKCVTGTGYDPGCYFVYLLPALVEGKIGLSAGVAIQTNLGQIRLRLAFMTGTKYYNYIVKYEHSTGKLYYLNPSAAWVQFSAITALYTDPKLFHLFKLVVDSKNWTYAHLFLDALGFDMSTFQPYGGALVQSAEVIAEVGVLGNMTTSSTHYVDDVVITQNEV